tara:strand:+ start:35 stop:277 length:243 start_codon:yes stop_codon:yes gene_type:complete
MARKFKKVKKTKKGTPLKYVRGSKSPSAREAEIRRTRELYRMGKLTPAMMDKISKLRSESATKKSKPKKKSKSKKKVIRG